MRTSIAGAFVIACLLGTILLSGRAHGQTVTPPPAQPYAVNMPFCSLRAPFCWPANYGTTLQMETKNLTTGKQALTGTVVKMPPANYITTSVLLANFVAPKTLPAGVTAIEVNAIRITFTIPDTTEHQKVADLSRRVWLRDTAGALKPARLLQAQTLGCRYDMPVQGFNLTESLKQMNVVWDTEKTGNIRCIVGVKAADIPAPFTLSPPPPVTPAPPPGTTAPIASSIKDGATISGSLVWEATATATPSSVEFFIDGVSRTTEYTAPYRFNGDDGVLDTKTLANGLHTLKITASYASGTPNDLVLKITVAN